MKKIGTQKVILFSLLLLLILGVGSLIGIIKFAYGGGVSFKQDTLAQSESMAEMVKLAELDHPPAQIASSSSGRLFISMQPHSFPTLKIGELVNGQLKPFLSEKDHASLMTPTALWVSADQKLWVVDSGNHGFYQSTIKSFDLNDGHLLSDFPFPRDIVPVGAYLSQVVGDKNGLFYLTDASVLGKNPALVIFDSQKKVAYRLLEDHISVLATSWVPQVAGKRLEIPNLMAIRPGVFALALSEDHRWLYYGAMNSPYLYRIETTFLAHPTLHFQTHGVAEFYAKKGLTAGMAMHKGTLFLTNPGQSGIEVIGEDRKNFLISKNESCKWPYGISFVNNEMFVTCSALGDTIFALPSSTAKNAPYFIYKASLPNSLKLGQL